MAKKQGDIRFGVQFQVDKSGLNELKSSLQQLQNLTIKDLVNTSNTEKANDQLNKIKETASKVTKALEESYNVKLDTTNLSKFQKTLELSGLSLSQIKAEFMEAGVQGQIAFRNLTTELATTNKYIKQSSQLLDKMADTLSNTVRWTIASSALNAVTGSVQKAFSYTQKLDKSLNDIVIVTGKSSEEMDKFARKANDAAKALGATTTDYTKASLIYYQQGLSDREVEARANVTTKVANVTGQSAETTSEQLTAIWNGYKVSAQEAELYIDKVSAVAATTAADLEELATGMSKVASAANIMGVDIDQLNAQLATIVSVTREAPESIGTALKTVYARMSDIEAGLDDETSLGEYTKQMEALGIRALDINGNLRDMGDVVEEIGGKWGTFSRNQQVALAQVIAGTRQYSRMMALFDNWDMYESAKKTSEDSVGALEQQNQRYLDSMEAHLNQLSAAAEGLYASLLDPESLNGLIDGLTKIVELVDNMVQGLGGGGNVLMTLGSIGLNVFGDQLTRGLSSALRNTSGLINNMRNANVQAEIFAELMNLNEDDLGYQKIKSQMEEIFEYSHLMTDEERQQAELLLKKRATLVNTTSELEAQAKKAQQLYEAYTGNSIDLTLENAGQEYTDALSGVFKGDDPQETADAFLSLYNQRKKLGYARGGLSNLETNLGKMQNIPNALETAAAEGKYVSQDEYSQLQDKTPELLQKIEDQKNRIARKNQEILELEEQQEIALADQVSVIEEFSASLSDNGIDKFAATGLFSKEELQNLQEAKKIFDKISKEKVIQEKDIKAATQATQNYAEAVKRVQTEIKKNSAFAKTYADNKKKMAKSDEDATDSLNKFLKSLNLNKAVEGIVKLAGGFANVGTALNNIKNIGNIWSNESLTGGEKLLQTLTNISFTIPMLVSGFSNLKQGMTALHSLWDIVTAKMTANKVASQALIATKQGEMLTSAQYFTILKTGNKERDKEILQTILAAKCGDAKAKSDLKQALSQKTLAGAIKTTTKAISEQTVKLLKNPTTLIILGIVAAIGALTFAISAGSKAYNKYNLALEESTKAMEHQKQNYEDVKKAYDDLKKSIEDYEGSQKAIDELTEGTQEWKDAIVEANKQITELIAKYPKLAQYLNPADSSGRLTLNEDGLKMAENAAKRSMNLAYAQSLAATVQVNKASELAQAEKISHKSSFSEEEIIKIAEFMNTEQGSGMTIVQAAESVFGKMSDSQIAALNVNSKEIKSLSEEIRSNTASNKVLNAQIMSSYASQFNAYNNSDYQGVIDSVLGEEYAKINEQLQDEYDDSGEKTDAEIQKEYAEMMVKTGQWQSLQSVSNKSGNKGKYTYIDASGNVQSGVEIDDKVARQALASYEAQKRAGADLNKIIAATNKLSAILPDTLGKALLTSSFTNGGQGDLSTLTGAEKDKLKELLADVKTNLSDDEARTLGYKSAQDYIHHIEAAIDAYTNTANELNGELIGKIGDEAFDALTLAGQKTISNWFKDFTDVEQAAAEQILKEIGSDSAELMEEIIDTDWQDKNQIYDLTAKIQKMAPNLNIEDVEAFIDGLEKANGVFGIFDLKATQESYKAVDQIMSSLKETGDIIDTDQFKTLGERYDEYFITMADGSKKLIADAKEFYKIVYEDRVNEAENSVVDAVNAWTDFQSTKKERLNTPELKNFGEFVWKDAVEYGKTRIPQEWINLIALMDEKQLDVEQRNAFTESDITFFSDMVNAWLASGFITEDESNNLLNDLSNGTATGRTILRLQELLNQYGEDSVTNIWTEDYANFKSGKTESDLLKNLNDSIENYLNVAGMSIFNSVIADESGDLWTGENGLTDENKKLIKERKAFLQTQFNTMFNAPDATDSITRLSETLPKLDESIEVAANNLDRFANQLNSTVDVLDRTEYDWDKLLQLTSQEMDMRRQKIQDLDDFQYNFEANELKSYIEKFGLNNLVATDEINNWLEDPIAYQNDIKKAVNAAQTIDSSGSLKQEFEDFNTIFTEYLNNAYKNIPNAIQEWQDSLLWVLETNVEHFRVALDKVMEKGEVQRDFNNYLRNLYKDNDKVLRESLNKDFLSYVDTVDQLGASFQELQNTTIISDADLALWEAEYANELDEHLKKGMTQQQYKNELQILYNNALKTSEELEEAITQLEEAQLEKMDEIAQNYADQVSYLEQINSLYDHQISLAELVGRKNGETLEQYNDRLEGYYKQQENNLKTMREKYQSEYEYWQKYLTTLDPTSDAYKNAQDKMLEAGKNAAAMGVEYGQMVADNFKRTVENSVNELFDGLNRAKEELDWLRSDAERYYNKVDAYFEISKLEASIRKDLSDNKSVNAQRKIAEFLDLQVIALRDIDKLSEADLKRAQAKYDLLQAQIALEEAQANKTQMRLVRGADGSYSYEYVADTGAIAEKEQEVLEAQQAIMDLDKEEVKNHFDEIYDITQEFIDKYIDAFSDLSIDADEQVLLGDIWNSLVEQLGDTDKIIERLRQSTRDAAKALGINDLENMTDADLATLFPELDSSMYGLYRQWMTGESAFNEDTFNQLMTTDAEGAKSILKALGLATDSQLSSLGQAYGDLLSENSSALKQNKLDMEALTGVVNESKAAYDSLSKTLETVIAQMAIANMVATGSTQEEAQEYVNGMMSIVPENPYSGDTGGYTGEWGSEGKFLLAHEKELILNKTDTANILNAVDIIRDLQFSLDASVAGRLAEMMKSYNSSMQAWDDSKDWTIEQNIQINAEFPNATDSDEIERAFEELLNMAAQRIAER